MQSSHKRLQHCRFQFTPLREGRLVTIPSPNAARKFQFTPLREGRRGCPHDAQRRLGISIHAPPRGATSGDCFRRRSLLPISIHAPPRGATSLAICMAKYVADFNSRPSARGDLLAAEADEGRIDFNSRPSARGDDCIRKNLAKPAYFNSRPSARGDSALPIVPLYANISIHAPPRGATQ